MNDRPQNGAIITEDGARYYVPHYPEFVDTGYKLRRESPNGTQVRNTEYEEWKFAWDANYPQSIGSDED